MNHEIPAAIAKIEIAQIDALLDSRVGVRLPEAAASDVAYEIRVEVHGRLRESLRSISGDPRADISAATFDVLSDDIRRIVYERLPAALERLAARRSARH